MGWFLKDLLLTLMHFSKGTFYRWMMAWHNDDRLFSYSSFLKWFTCSFWLNDAHCDHHLCAGVFLAYMLMADVLSTTKTSCCLLFFHQSVSCLILQMIFFIFSYLLEEFPFTSWSHSCLHSKELFLYYFHGDYLWTALPLGCCFIFITWLDIFFAS